MEVLGYPSELVITIRDLYKSFSSQELFEGTSLQINEGDRFALVGPNGAGKSTLFKMLLGEMEPDRGEIALRRGVVVGYLPQENAPSTDQTVLTEALAALHEPNDRTVAQAKAVLMGLGFRVTDFDRPVNALSGGWAMRVAMAKLLMQEPDLLLLDEPTNHLDLESLLWFQEYLLNYPGAIFVISHDRSFINTVCKAIVSVQERQLKIYYGNYEAYVVNREAEGERLKSAYRQQQEEIARMQDFIDRNRARASTANRAQSMIKRLEKMDLVELPENTKTVKFKFPQPGRAGQLVVSLKNLDKHYGSVQVYQKLNFDLPRGWKMALVGHNGAGKSTLLKILGGVLEFDGGERILGHNVKVGYFSQHRADALVADRTVLEEAMDNDRMLGELLTRTILGSFLFRGDAVFKKVKVLSGGEKSRLSLAKLLLDPPNVLLLDEPTVHLDMDSVEMLVAALKDFEGTIGFISHDLYFVNAIAQQVVHVDQGRVTVYPGNYEYFQWKKSQQHLFEPLPQAKPEEKKILPSAKLEERVASGPLVFSKNAEKKRLRQLDQLAKGIDDLKMEIEVWAKLYEDPEVQKNFTKLKFVGEKIQGFQGQLQASERRLAEFLDDEGSKKSVL